MACYAFEIYHVPTGILTLERCYSLGFVVWVLLLHKLAGADIIDFVSLISFRCFALS